MIVRREWHRDWLGIQVDYVDEETAAAATVAKFYSGLVGTAWQPAAIHDFGHNPELRRLVENERRSLDHCFPQGTCRPYREER